MVTSSKGPRGGRRPASPGMDGPVPVRLDQLDRDGAGAPMLRKRPASSSELRVGILLWPGFPLLSLAGLCDGLRHAADIGDQSRQVRCSWAILGCPGDSVAASCRARVQIDRPLTAPPDFDYVAVIGGLLPQLNDMNPQFPVFLRSMAEAGTPLMGICTGSFVLARLGLLNGHAPCIHPYHVDDWKAAYPDLPFETDCHYAMSHDRITCAGGLSIIELTAELVRRHCGADRAAKVVHQMTVTSTGASTHIGRRHALGYHSTDHEKLRKALVLMEMNIATPLEIAVLARLVNSSSRQLERVFLAETGCTPSEQYRRLRLKYARYLLTTTDLPILTIAIESGFSDSSHFIRHFQLMYGMPPGRLRKAMQPRPPEAAGPP
jgi:transcriptional regulator GlxA family with amidase domain